MSDTYEKARLSARNIALLACSILGLGVSVYLTLAHYSTSVNLVCSDSGAINCTKVTTSPQSVIFGIPVAVLGLVYFVPMIVMSLPMIYRSSSRLFAYGRLALSVTGIGFVLYLLYSELFTIHAICLWCSSVHVLTFVIFCLVVSGWPEVMGYVYEGDGA